MNDHNTALYPKTHSTVIKNTYTVKSSPVYSGWHRSVSSSFLSNRVQLFCFSSFRVSSTADAGTFLTLWRFVLLIIIYVMMMVTTFTFRIAKMATDLTVKPDKQIMQPVKILQTSGFVKLQMPSPISYQLGINPHASLWIFLSIWGSFSFSSNHMAQFFVSPDKV